MNVEILQQGGYAKYSCFPCEWYSRNRAQHWIKKDWPKRASLTPLKILLPPLHIKLGIMKQFVKALLKDGLCFMDLCAKI